MDTKEEQKKWLSQLKRVNPRKLDGLFHEAHDSAFSCIECLECANCCKTTGPRFTNKDVGRISKHLRMKEIDFINQYLKTDEDNDLVLQSVPCSFLGSDNYCSIYDVRPKACREYPHTNRVKQTQLLKLHLTNLPICPAVDKIAEEVGNKIYTKG